VPPDVALLLPEPDDGGLPALKPLELPELPELELLGLLELREAEEPAEAPLDLLAGLPWWLLDPPDEREIPALEPTACRAEPGRTSVITPAAAIPPTPATAVSDRTTDRPRSLAATALATLLRFMTTPRNIWRFLWDSGQAERFCRPTHWCLEASRRT
jgi:hypothetical protein